jgi:hypothetical protein
MAGADDAERSVAVPPQGEEWRVLLFAQKNYG